MNTNMAGLRWFSKLCGLVLWTKVASALEGLKDFASLRPYALIESSPRIDKV